MNVETERSKQISVNDLVKAAEKVWGEMPMVQIMLRDEMFKELITRLAFNLGLINQVFYEEKIPE